MRKQFQYELANLLLAFVLFLSYVPSLMNCGMMGRFLFYVMAGYQSDESCFRMLLGVYERNAIHWGCAHSTCFF